MLFGQFCETLKTPISWNKYLEKSIGKQRQKGHLNEVDAPMFI